MAIHQALKGLSGTWKGTNRLNFGSYGNVPILESPSTAKVVERVGGQALEIAYTWEYEGKQKEGFLLIDGSADSDAVKAVFTDSFHLAHDLMKCEGSATPEGGINVTGTYVVPGHPEWSWRTEIIPANDSFKYVMYNVSPEGEEEWAVETEFTRA